MIEKLEQLTIAQFVDLICDDTSILTGAGKDKSSVSVAVAMRNIVFEYKSITDSAGVNSYLSHVEELIKAKLSSIIFTMCKNLVELREYVRVREVLVEYGINAQSMADERVAAEVASRLARAKDVIAQIEQERQSESIEISRIRSDFDAQTAALMAHFKFQIDTTTMRATVYAHLVERHNREIKAMMAAMKK